VTSAPRALAAALLLTAAPAAAHVRLLEPPSRYGDENKIRPCGRLGGTRSPFVTTFAPGQVITVSFEEFINHPGYYRIAFDPAGDAALAPPTFDLATQAWSNPAGVLVLADRIADAAAGLTRVDVQVTLPDVECASCTLQLIQVMTDKLPFDGSDDFYYQCADLGLTTTPPPRPPAVEPAGGCGSAGGPWTWAGLLGLLLALAAARRSPARR
jgi:hypothetical protein